MNNETIVSGSIAIEPPITWRELKQKWPADDRLIKDIHLELDETEVDADDGVMILRKAVAIVPTFCGAYQACNLTAHVQEVVDHFGKNRTFTGYLECQGETHNDPWRVCVRDGKAVEINADTVQSEE